MPFTFRSRTFGNNASTPTPTPTPTASGSYTLTTLDPLPLVDIFKVKTYLGIDLNNGQQDVALNFYIRLASAWIAEELGRENLGLCYWSEYYQGTGTQSLNLRNRPVYPAFGTEQQIKVYSDPSGYFGCGSGLTTNSGVSPFTATTLLTYGSDYCLQIDQNTNSSRCGTLVGLRTYWYKPRIREAGYLYPFTGRDTGSYFIQYLAGWSTDSVPSYIQDAAVFLVSKIKYVLPLGLEIGSESYEDRAIGIATRSKNYWMSLVRPMMITWRNWKF